MVTLALAGDVMLGRGVSEALGRRPPAAPWGDLLPLLAEADLRLVNLECALTTAEARGPGPPKAFYFRADSARATACLRAAGIDAVALANNHVLDFGPAGLRDTLAALRAAGIAWAGAGEDLAEAERPALLEAGGARVALVALTDNEPDWAAGPGRPGTHYLPAEPTEAALAELGRSIASARAAGAELVVLSNHWGPNMVSRPEPGFRAFARAAIDLGADLYFGHSAHVFQGVELYRGRPILYDAGDLLDDYVVDRALRNDWSFLFRARFEGRAFRGLELCPVELGFASARQAREPARRLILGRMHALSAELGTALAERGGRLYLEPGPELRPAAP